MLQTILLATDGSPGAARATDMAAALALRFGAGVIVVHAQSALGAAASAQSVVAGACARLHDLGIAGVDAEIVQGPPVNVILGAAESRQPDVLIVGARGTGTWPGAMLGSVSAAVVQRAGCPVLVVR